MAGKYTLPKHTGTRLWDPLPNETDGEYDSFVSWRQAGCPNLSGWAEAQGLDLASAKAWASEHNWSLRARAWMAWVHEIERREIKRAAKLTASEWSERSLEVLGKLLTLTDTSVQAALESGETLAPHQIGGALAQVVKFQRLILGETTENIAQVPIGAMSEASDEDLERLRAALVDVGKGKPALTADEKWKKRTAKRLKKE